MTSFMISAFEDRSIPQTWFDEDCVFCKIVAKKTNAFVVWENEDVIAFLGVKIPLNRSYESY